MSGCCHNIRNLLWQMGSDGDDLCSQFSRYISPAYHHDKCERCVQMRLYSMNKGEITFVYFIFVILWLLALIIGLSGPPIEYTSYRNISESTTSAIFGQNGLEHGGPFNLTTPPLTRYNKQLWLYAILHTENVDDEVYAENMLLSVSAIGLRSSQGDQSIRGKNQSDTSAIFQKYTFKNRTRHVECNKRICDPIMVAHLGFIKFVRYRFYVKFHHLESFHRKYTIKQVTFVFRSYTPEYTQIEMSFRIIYVIMTFFATLWFGNSLRKYAISDWAYEQKWLMILLPLLLLYDGPTYSMTTICDHWLIGFLDSISQITFLAGTTLFNLCIYHAFRQNERRFIPFYLEKVVIVFVLWVLSATIAYYQKVYEYLDYSFSFKLDSVVYQTITKWWVLFVVFYMIYLLLSMLKAYTDLRTMPFFDKRLRFATTNVAVLGTIWYGTWSLDYGITGILEDQYTADIKDKQSHTTSVTFMALYASLNFYVYLMVYVYSPAQKSIFENVVMKDNPTFSMINDSDEDDITTTTLPSKTRTVTDKLSLYTSEDDDGEDSLCPLNRANAQNRTDESD
ncbi:transmembrane protein 181-like [Planococcus citri]|uniref:transmembrane protein 181-like n=1 Tax=Planococcus citri TaxID=170843 RepID=UPI0031F75CB0